jgi:nitrilase
MDDQGTVKVAAVHAASEFLDLDRSVDKACTLIEQAGQEGAGLVVFPETYLPGYPFWIWSHTPAEGAPLFAELYRNAVELPSDATRRIGDAARRARAWVVMGLNEREGGTLYNTLAYFDDHGRLLARHRKLQPTNAERTIWGRGDGRDVFVVDAPFGRLGGLICFEHSMDLNRYALTAMGEQIHIAAWPAISAMSADPNSSNFDNLSETACKYHALAAQAYVVCVQSRIDEAVIERLGLVDQPDRIRVGGGWSAIIGPDAQFVAGPHRDEETILFGEVDLGVIPFAKFFCDSAGHYARPDVFSFAIDARPQTPLTGASPRMVAMPELLGPETAELEGDAEEDEPAPLLMPPPAPMLGDSAGELDRSGDR